MAKIVYTPEQVTAFANKEFCCSDKQNRERIEHAIMRQQIRDRLTDDYNRASKKWQSNTTT